jgi:hypothetical protein
MQLTEVHRTCLPIQQQLRRNTLKTANRYLGRYTCLFWVHRFIVTEDGHFQIPDID